MVDEGTLFARLDTSYWLDAGTPEAYLQANTDLLDGAWSAPLRGTRVGSTLRMDGAVVSPSANVERSVLSAGVVIGDDAVVLGAVLLAGAIVEDGATVADSVVGPRAVVGRGSTLAGHCLVASDVRVPHGARLEGAGVAE
jgi:mannose-1-phosphate guanylyltransferase